jgi:multidrug resistance efflux pump
MFELLLCSTLTILPDYLFRRYAQGKRFGQEINFYTVWFELRWGITGCLILTVLLITTVFYNHPATTSVTLFYRTIPLISETTGRVAEVFVSNSQEVKKGQPIFRLDSSAQQAAVESARRKLAEEDAQMAVARTDLEKADNQLQEAQSSLQQATDELETKQELQRRSPGIVPTRDIEKLQNIEDGRRAAMAAAQSSKRSVEERINTLLPAEKASAEAALAQAQVDLDKTVIRAGVDGRVEQFVLRVGEIITPIMRPAGILIPADVGQRGMAAGFGQIEAQIMKPGMIAEITCVSQPFTIIPMVVADVQNYIAAGQVRSGEQLLDPSQVARPGTLIAFLEPLYKGGIDDITPGSSCIANAYSNNHDAIADPGTSTFMKVVLHTVDALALIHALILRLQALVLPFQTLVFSGH